MESLNSNSQEREMHQLQQMQDKAKEKCMDSFRLLHSHLKDLSIKTVENADLKALIQEKVFANVALKNELRKLKGNSVDTKFAKPSILGKPVLQPPRNQSVVRQPNAFKSERPNFSKPRFASQIDVNNVLSKPVTQHYLPKGRESAFAKPNHMIASSSSRNSSKNMPRFSSNDMVHNYYLEEAKKKTQERDRKSTTSVMPYARSQNTTKSCKSKPRSNNQTSRPVYKIHERSGILCAKIQPNKTRNSNKPVDPTSHTQKPDRKIVTGHSFSPNKSSAVHEKTNTPRSYLRWIPTGRIFNTAGLKWVPTGKNCNTSTTKDEQGTMVVDYLRIHHSCFMIMVSVDNTSGPAPQRKEECTPSVPLLYTSRLLDAACKKVLNLLKKGLLVLGEAKGQLQQNKPTSQAQVTICIKVKEFQRSFRHSDTERLSRSDEVLKLKNFKKDATLKLYQVNKSSKVFIVQDHIFTYKSDKEQATSLKKYQLHLVHKFEKKDICRAQE
ncbi:hypothetical protein Tco_0149409 [Tanacetum coccineum]